MQSVDNLLIMNRCASCDRELASTWKFCLYCGQSTATADFDFEEIPSAIRGEDEPAEPSKYDGPFWVGISMGVLGLALIIYAAIQIYGSYV